MEEMSKVTVKFVVSKAANRVLFAEGGKDFIDVLLHIHELPVGTVSRLVHSVSEDALGSVQNIMDSIRSLPDRYMILNHKAALLDPEVRNCASKLKVSSTSKSSRQRIDYTCKPNYNCCKAVLDNPPALCPYCRIKCENKLAVLFDPSDEAVVKLLDGEDGYTKGVASYTVSDDLVVKPMMLGSCFNLFREFNVKRLEDIEEKVVDVGSDECTKSIRSKTVLTDIFAATNSSA